MENCKGCAFYKPVEGPRGYCFIDPPKVLLMPMQAETPNIKAAQVQQQVIMQPVSVRPVVNESDFCGQWDEPEDKQDSSGGVVAQ